MTTDTGLEAGPSELHHSIGDFVDQNETYYSSEFSRIQDSNDLSNCQIHV